MGAVAAAALATPPARRAGLQARKARLLALCALPAAVTVLALVAWPIWLTVELSLHRVQLFDILRDRPLGFTTANYERLLVDARFWESLGNTAVFVTCSVGLAMAWGLGSALLLDRRFPGRAAVRLAVILPWAVPATIGSLVWMFLFDGHLGLVNHLLLSAGLLAAPISFLVHAEWAMVAVVLAHAWQSYPFFTVMLLAALQSVPPELHDAARVDGAGFWQRFRHITLPALRNTMVVSGFLSLLAAIRDVETVLVMTGGGPGRATETLAIRIWNESFRFYDVGFGAAQGVVAFGLSLLLMAFALRRLMRSFWG
jgi:multiple sugar transport system permease protein